MKKLLFLFILFVIFLAPNYSQILDAVTNQDKEPGKIITKDGDPNFKTSPTKSFYKSKADWQHIIDSIWGPGVSTATKLSVFDTFWNLVDQSWGGFPNLNVNWDSLRNVYRPLVEAGVSRGRFAGILSRLTRALQECHAGVIDTGIDSTMGLYPFNDLINYPSFYYRPGIPIININILGFRTNFGAGLTLLPDNSILVYSVMPNHPLGLQPGDIILGYEGIPWIQLLNDLFSAELPMLSSTVYATIWGSSPASVNHTTMMSAGMNWGLFDTIDVVKYPANDTLHYPTSLLTAITPPYHMATEQLPVKGVPFPDIKGNKMVSWGIVEGTNIGYIYAWDWGGAGTGTTESLFGQAVDELMHIHNVTGLILDFRTNTGGIPDFANEGLKHLFNVDPTVNYSSAQRVNGNDHYSFTIDPNDAVLGKFTPTNEVFDHPIAVLLGPNCLSAGDYNAFRLRFHPMARSFGKPTNGAYTHPPVVQNSKSPYFWRVDGGCVYSNVNNEGHMIHKSFPVDEEVWLTREGVVKGEDDVVKRALEWINNSVYGYNLTKNNTFCNQGIDTLKLSAIIENPNSHQVSSKIYIRNLQGNFIDSLDLHKVGSSGNSETWNGNYIAPAIEDIFNLSISVTDNSNSKNFTIDNISRFTTVGPVVLDSISCKKTSTIYSVKTFLRNLSTTTTITKPSVKLICDDPWVLPISPNVQSIKDIPPGSVISNGFGFSVKYIDSLFPGYFRFKVEVISDDGWTYWVDSTHVITTGVEEELVIPLTFKLGQNYPNPFNPSTKISFVIPKSSFVILKVYDILGNEVKTLVNEEKPACNYEVEFNGSNLSSGVYFYQLRAENFVQTKKLVLMK